MIKKAKYKNPVEFIQFDGTNQEAIKEFTGSAYIETVKFMDKDELVAIQFETNGRKQQIHKGWYILKSFGDFGFFEPDRFELIYEIID